MVVGAASACLRNRHLQPFASATNVRQVRNDANTIITRASNALFVSYCRHSQLARNVRSNPHFLIRPLN